MSGLLAVGYSASPLASGLGARWLFGTSLRPGFVGGGLLGLAQGQGPALSDAASWWLSLLDLSLAGSVLTFAGAALAVAGNLLMLGPLRRRPVGRSAA